MTNSFQQQLAEDRFGFLVSARLSDSVEELPYDVSERLRAARTRALANRKIAVIQTVTSIAVSGSVATMTFGTGNFSWWNRIAAVIPLLALALGLIAISAIQNDNTATELAEVDSALLTDDLPPSAYADPGFSQFLKLNSAENQ
jgi:SNF family Na+-dependent transporter